MNGAAHRGGVSQAEGVWQCEPAFLFLEVLPCLGMRVLSKSDRSPGPWVSTWVSILLAFIFSPQILQGHLSAPFYAASFWKFFLLKVLAVSVESTLISHSLLFSATSQAWLLLYYLPLACLLSQGLSHTHCQREGGTYPALWSFLSYKILSKWGKK